MSVSLPPLLMTSEPGSFARSTIVERKPQIIAQAIADNGYPPATVQALDALAQEIAQGAVELLAASEPDASRWNRDLDTYEGCTWLDLPWYLAESYFYRRLLGAVRYFEPGPWQCHDPFELQKQKQGHAAATWLTAHWEQLAGTTPEELFVALLHSCLWGNRADLSNYTIREQAQGGLATRRERHNILIDHTVRATRMLSAGVDRVDFINDNAGLELLFDLTLADFLLGHGWTRTVVFHLKKQPFFVSDAMPKEVRQLVSLLATEPLGERLSQHLALGVLRLEDDAFWTTGLMFDRMPPPLSQELGSSDLVLIKGDVNYRRLLGDRHWPYDTNLHSVAAYFPAPFLVLRTLKGEIVVGLEPGQAELLATVDPNWLINGKRGIIQLQSETN